ncbi:histidine phosphatase family protein [Rhodocytophaga aerolata]|uniref:Histidine phosphatase family protein n=1 Tax=Rhodocytophaga aerolata TaxID=455078 RepID=A0ABT8R9C5_9BACT|nr:histidine phosphatase family protein [Rhodocytophaga aerolata]MDO1448694.1 histidine phosphatase family protein [Rhodocytophaga aerolata]
MVKHLILLRHAQAEPYSPAVVDEERELTGTGIADASRMGVKLKSLQVCPEILICSPANRTVTTAQLIAEQVGYEREKIKTDPSLYETSMRNLMSVITSLPESLSQVLIVSHNPNLTYLAEYLTQDEIGTLPTCGCVNIKLVDKTWAELSGGSGSLVWFEYPGKN